MKYTTPSVKPVPEVKPEPVFTQKALGMYIVPQVGEVGAKYVLVEIPYNPETGESGKAKELYRDNREAVIDKFKITVDELKFFNGV